MLTTTKKLSLFAYFTLCLVLFFSCSKDTHNQGASLPRLTIDEARSIYLSLHKNASIVHSRNENEEHHGTYFELDWENADEYVDEVRHLSVVEVPVLANSLSKIQIVEEISPSDSSLFDQSEQVNKLVVARDTAGLISLVLLKINGTPDYLAGNDIGINSFQGLEPDFEGRLAYYDLNDSLLISYLVQNGSVYVSSIDTGSSAGTQERWGFCVLYYIYVSCTGDGHTWEQRSQCRCGTPSGPGCTPPRKIAVMGECGGPSPIIGGQGTDPILPPPPPTNPPSNGSGGQNGGGGNQNDFGCFVDRVGAFKSKYGIDLLAEDYENIALGCRNGCSGTDEGFEECVKQKILEAWTVEAPSNPIIDIDQRLNCFNINTNNLFNHKIILYVDQPTKNSDASFSFKESVGHTWLTLIQEDDTGNVVSLSIGFYPEISATPCDPIDGGAYGEDGGHDFDVSITWELTSYAFNLFINNLKSTPHPPLYRLGDYNCTTWALDQLSNLGLHVPATPITTNPFPLYPACKNKGLTPGRLGQDIRDDTYQPNGGGIKNLAGGTAPISNCQQ